MFIFLKAQNGVRLYDADSSVLDVLGSLDRGRGHTDRTVAAQCDGAATRRCGKPPYTGQRRDRIRMAGLAVPELTIWLTTFEISTVIEATTGLAVAWGAIRRVSVSAVLAILPFRSAALTKGKARRVRRNRRRSCVSPANDDEDGAGLALAA
jgi:hypothetical protein